MLCGGTGANATFEDQKVYQDCIRMKNGVWETSHQLQMKRRDHTSWNSTIGVILVGGMGEEVPDPDPQEYAGNTTELLKDDGGSTLWFPLKYSSSDSCLIDEGDTFLLTGGHYFPGMAARYDINGWVEDLDPLLNPRAGHSCYSNVNEQGQRVNLVCGGINYDSTFDPFDLLDNCEENIVGTSFWREIENPAPLLVSNVGLSVGEYFFSVGKKFLLAYNKIKYNIFIFLGGENDKEHPLSWIYRFSPDLMDLKLVGSLNTPRTLHSASIIDDESLYQICK